jgi:hypothetical protein
LLQQTKTASVKYHNQMSNIKHQTTNTKQQMKNKFKKINEEEQMTNAK